MNKLEFQSTKNLVMHGTALTLWWHTGLQFLNLRQEQEHKNIGTNSSLNFSKQIWALEGMRKTKNKSMTIIFNQWWQEKDHPQPGKAEVLLVK